MGITLGINIPKLAIIAVLLFAVLTVIWLTRRRSSPKDPNEIERLRRLGVYRRGRIVAAEIVGLLEPESSMGSQDARQPLAVVYKYEVAGVTYEVSQDVSSLPPSVVSGCSPGSQSASVRYDPKAPTNSIIACEDWSGI